MDADEGDVGNGSNLRVLIDRNRHHPCCTVIEIESFDSVLLTLVQVQGTLMQRRKRSRTIDGADEPGLSVDDAHLRPAARSKREPQGG